MRHCWPALPSSLLPSRYPPATRPAIAPQPPAQPHPEQTSPPRLRLGRLASLAGATIAIPSSLPFAIFAVDFGKEGAAVLSGLISVVGSAAAVRRHVSMLPPPHCPPVPLPMPNSLRTVRPCYYLPLPRSTAPALPPAQMHTTHCP